MTQEKFKIIAIQSHDLPKTAIPKKNAMGNTAFRDYPTDNDSIVLKTYKEMQQRQTRKHASQYRKECVRRILAHENKISRADLVDLLKRIVDSSDPDTNLTQNYHGDQTAYAMSKAVENLYHRSIKTVFTDKQWANLPEPIQEQYEAAKTFGQLYPHIKNWDFLIAIAYFHDVGKILTINGYGLGPEKTGLDQWSVVGDTFPVGGIDNGTIIPDPFPFSRHNLFYKEAFFRENPDLTDGKTIDDEPENLDARLRQCGFETLLFSFGHDEYGYQVLKNNLQEKFLDIDTPEAMAHGIKEGLYIVRFHSFYPWHTDGAYAGIASETDWTMLPLQRLFQRQDLYSKTDILPEDNADDSPRNESENRPIPWRTKISDISNTYFLDVFNV